MINNLFEDYGAELSAIVQNVLKDEMELITIPNKVEKKLERIAKKELLEIYPDVDITKELILVFLSNLSSTFVVSKREEKNKYLQEGYKTLHSDILFKQLTMKIDRKSKRIYPDIIDLLIKHNIIEKGRTYQQGVNSNEYRLTKTYFGKGVKRYKLKTPLLIKRNKAFIDENLKRVMKCSIAKNELKHRHTLQFPSTEEVRQHLLKKVEEGATNKKGMKLVLRGKKSADNFPNCVFVEDYIQIYEYLQLIFVPIVAYGRGGGRVITAFNFMPSLIRPLIKYKGEPLAEADYSCLHPNIINFLYGGSGDKITHDKVADWLNIDRRVAKIEHLSFFNKHWNQMKESPLFDYYQHNEPIMVENLRIKKELDGYKETSKECFEFETDLMRRNVEKADEENIRIFYCFDALYCKKEDLKKLKTIMNSTAKNFRIPTEA